MAVPGRSGAYANQSSADVGDAIAFALDDAQWTNNPTSFEVNVLPPGFTVDDPITALGGIAGCKMIYIIFVRGINADGKSAWVPLQWTVSSIVATARILYGLPIDWPATPQRPAAGGAIVIFVKRPGSNDFGAPIGTFYANDVAIDGSAAQYGNAFRGFQILSNGVGATFLRASNPGWEVIIDTNG